MKCISCTAEIPANWSHAINNNLCPSCGGPIMDEDSKSLLDELREAMAKMPNDPEGLSGWLLSNYRLIKIGSAEPTEFYKKNVGKKSSGLKVNDNPVERLLRRAGMDKQLSKQRELADLARKIKSGEVEGQQYIEAPEDDEVEVSDMDYADSSESDPYEEDYTPAVKLSSAITSKSSSLVDPNLEPLDNRSMEAAIQAVSSMGEEDTDVLNMQRMLRLRKQQELETMGSIGKIKRSS